MPRARRISALLPSTISRSILGLKSGAKSRSSERGYILLTLIFFVAVLAIGLTVILPSVIHEAKRDREEEMVHRGVQYSRAIRAYFKKFGRYPAKIEDLESTNNLRFLRRRYKDPLTGEDFKLLRYGDPAVKIQGVGGLVPGQGQLAPGQAGLVQGSVGQGGQGAGALNRGPGILQQTGGGMNPTPQQNPTDPNQNPDNAGAPAVDANGNPVPNPNNGQSGSDNGQAANANGESNNTDKQPASGPTNPTFGGGAIVGVASTSRKETIREYNKKHHYNEWQFIYDPGTDRGGLINTPAQPQVIGSTGPGQGNQGQPGTPVQPGVQPAQPGGPAPNPPPIGDPQQ